MFKKVKALNLFSWESLDYTISNGVSQITGFNYDDSTSEGSGKSSIPNILCWTLYGKIPKNVKVDEVVREGCKSGNGEVELEDGSRIIRSRKPNNLYILTSKGEKLQGKDSKETQKIIDNYLGLDFDAYCYTVYFAQNHTKSFVNSSEIEKAKILSEVLDLNIFDRARKKVQEERKKLEKEEIELDKKIIENKSEINIRESKINTYKEVIDTFEVEKYEKEKELETKIKELKNDEKILKSNILDLKIIDKDKTVEEAKLQDLVSKKNKLEKHALKVKNQILEKQKLENHLNSTLKTVFFLEEQLKKYEGNLGCPTCGAKLSENQKEKIFSDIESLNNKLDSAMEERNLLISEIGILKNLEDPDNLLREKNELEEQIVKQKQKLESIIEKETRSKEIELTAKFIDSEIEKKIKDLNRLKAETKTKEKEIISSLTKELKGFSIEKKDLKTSYNKIKELASKYDILKGGFKKVKSYVFQGFLGELSRKTTEILAEFFEVPISIEFTNEKEGEINKIETIVSIDGKPRSLGLCSGGQYRRISLAVDLALSSIVANRSQRPIDFRVFDEPFKDLSFSSMEKVLRVINNLKGSTVIIEHNDLVKSIIDNVFEVEFKNGISRQV